MEKKGMINVYKCPFGHETVTVVSDDGTTPFIIKCRGAENCSHEAQSGFYRVPQDLTPHFEWYKPTDLKGFSPNMLQHIEMGGLVLRELPKKEAKLQPILNEEFYVWVAPDGNMQLTLLAPDPVTCAAMAKLLSKTGFTKSPHEMKLNGFTMQKVKVTIVQG